MMVSAVRHRVIDHIYSHGQVVFPAQQPNPWYIYAWPDDCSYVYESDKFFPLEVHLTASQARQTIIDQSQPTQTSPAVLEAGMVGRLLPNANAYSAVPFHDAETQEVKGILVPILEPRHEEFIVTVMDSGTTNQAARLLIEKPVNVPVCPDRWSVRCLKGFGTLIPSGSLDPARWVILRTLRGLTIPENMVLLQDPLSSLVGLTLPDQTELRQYLYGTYREALPIFDPLSHALCTQSIELDYDKVLTGLRLFKTGYLDYGLNFHFSPESIGYSIQDKPIGVPDGPKYILSSEEVPALQSWIQQFLKLEIEPESVMARAIARFNRGYTGDLYERITDTVIGLETLVAPTDQMGEITYRLSQRVGFIVADDPEVRLGKVAEVKKAYDVRSGMVHSGRGKEKVDEILAVESQDWLRRSIVAILKSDERLRKEFCQANRKNGNAEKNRFYNALISFGDWGHAMEYWLKPSR